MVQKAVELGNITAMYNMGFMYQRGFGVEKDYVEALRWYKLSADQNYKDAIKAIGEIYKHAGYGVERDEELAKEWQQKLADSR